MSRISVSAIKPIEIAFDSDKSARNLLECSPSFEQVAESMLNSWISSLRGPGSQKTLAKERITIRLSPEVVMHFRATGRGWQTRMDEALKEWLKTHS